jgi:hypothetical protein
MEIVMVSSALEEEKATVCYLVHKATKQMQLPASSTKGFLQRQPTPWIRVFLEKLVVAYPRCPAQAA